MRKVRALCLPWHLRAGLKPGGEIIVVDADRLVERHGMYPRSLAASLPRSAGLVRQERLEGADRLRWGVPRGASASRTWQRSSRGGARPRNRGNAVCRAQPSWPIRRSRGISRRQYPG